MFRRAAMMLCLLAWARSLLHSFLLSLPVPTCPNFPLDLYNASIFGKHAQISNKSVEIHQEAQIIKQCPDLVSDLALTVGGMNSKVAEI